RLLKFTVERMVEAHEAAGAAHVITQELWIDQPGHLLGTARMGRPRNIGRGFLRKDPRRRQRLHRRRQHLRHFWFGEPHLHYQRLAVAGGQESRRTGLCPKGTVMTTSSDRRLSVPPRHTKPPRPLTDREHDILLRIAANLI